MITNPSSKNGSDHVMASYRYRKYVLSLSASHARNCSLTNALDPSVAVIEVPQLNVVERFLLRFPQYFYLKKMLISEFRESRPLRLDSDRWHKVA